MKTLNAIIAVATLSCTAVFAQTISQENACESAESYLETGAFSRKGLISQLRFEGYSLEDATYAVEAVAPDWKAQAVKSAEEYLDTSSFSRSGLFEQLRYEGFTKEEARHGVEQAYGAPAKPAIRNAERPVDAREMKVAPAVAEGNVMAAAATVAKPAVDLESFVKAYIQSGASDTSSPVLEIAFYADHVDYFEHGLVDRDFIARDVRDYAKRWPQRWLAINGPIEFTAVNVRTVRATFQTSFGAANAKKAVRGVVESVLMIDIAGNQPEIISAKSYKIDA